MASRGKNKAVEPAQVPEIIADYRFNAKRTNIPPAGLAAQGRLESPQRIRYAYDPHRPPQLRFDGTGSSDKLPELVATARQRPLTDEEARLLADALRSHQPWLEWSGKREKRALDLDPVALHIHERIAAQAIVKVAARQDVQRDLFADPKLTYREAVQFYQHDMDWANRMILGDSLQVMASLARREKLAGRVQMIYIDPPYGIKFASNFQPEVGKRDVKDKESDLTREPEMVKAYRDTWTLGVHSYLAYLRDRLIVAKELLADTGSIFVQISDENLHRVRSVMEEVFGGENLCAVISFRKTTGQSGDLLSDTNDYLLWAAKKRETVKFRPVYFPREGFEWVNYDYLMDTNGGPRKLKDEEKTGETPLDPGNRVYRRSPLTSASGSKTTQMPVEFSGREFLPGKGGWKTGAAGFPRLIGADRIEYYGTTLSYRRYTDDFPYFPVSNAWTDTASGGYGVDKIYVVQTNPKVIARCILMTTDPGDLVLDPTCGSGTTAYVAEQWGRRWITMDTSRVALSLARQRLITSKFDYFQLRPINADDQRRNPDGPWLSNGDDGPKTLDCETVPHVTLKSIVQNTALDAIFAQHQPMLEEKLKVLNTAVAKVGKDIRQKLAAKLLAKEKNEGKKSINDADRRRWLLPPANRDVKVKLTVDHGFTGWYQWEVPFDVDSDWPDDLQAALADYRSAWRVKMDEVNAAIGANAENEELVDRPRVKKNVVRVSGPFTMEAVMPAELGLDEDSLLEDVDGDLESFAGADVPQNTEAFLDRMLRLLKHDGVRFPDNKTASFVRLSPLGAEFLHAEGEWIDKEGKTRGVAVSVGPEFGPVTAWQVEHALTFAARQRIYEDLVIAGFSFDAEAQALIQDDPNPQVRCHLAHIRPDVNMGGLLKDTPNAQLFTVFGSPRVHLSKNHEGMFEVTLQGVDIYNPVENTIQATSVNKVAAWFVDSDYDGRTFCMTQAFFPDKNAWKKLAKALKSTVNESAFDALSGTVSVPFFAGAHKRVAVKVIDPRGNEVMRVIRLDDMAEGHNA